MTSTEDKSTAVADKAGLKPHGELMENGKTIVYALLIALVLRVILFQPFTIPSASMEPTLYEGDYIIVSKFAYGWSKHSLPISLPIFKGRIFERAPQRGDIVVFKWPHDDKTDYIKRLIGLPGDRIQVKGGQLFINGQAVERKFAGNGLATCPGPNELQPGVPRYQETFPGGKSIVTNSCTGATGIADYTDVFVIPEHCYFMMGDNRDNSSDSRFDAYLPPNAAANACPGYNGKDGGGPGVGFVPAENLVGKADIILLSWHRGASLFLPWTWFTKARPSRFFHILQ
jgi:signal peptidase I